MVNSAHPPILVVDDNPDNAHIIRDYLEARGYPITVAYNGDEAVNKRQALQTGADDFVEKPFELSKLAATVERNIKLLVPTPAQ